MAADFSKRPLHRRDVAKPEPELTFETSIIIEKPFLRNDATANEAGLHYSFRIPIVASDT